MKYEKKRDKKIWNKNMNIFIILNLLYLFFIILNLLCYIFYKYKFIQKKKK